MPSSLHIPGRLADAVALGQTPVVNLPRTATSPAAGDPHENDPPEAAAASAQGPRKAFRGLAYDVAAPAQNAEFEPPPGAPTPANAGDLSPLSGLGERVRHVVQPNQGQSSPPSSPRTGAIIIYGDVHMPAVQHVQPAQDKTQPPLVRGGDQDQTPQAF